jgi:hypothetical protein
LYKIGRTVRVDITGSICGIKVTEEPCLEINACRVEKKKAVDSWPGRYNNPSSEYYIILSLKNQKNFRSRLKKL